MRYRTLGTITYYLEEKDLEFEIDYNIKDIIDYLKMIGFDFRPYQNGQFEIQCEAIEELINVDLFNLDAIESEDEFKQLCWDNHCEEFDI